MKPLDNEENMSKCVCMQCPLFNDCNKEKMEGFFCARDKSQCEMDAQKMCNCGNCSVFKENSLTGGYFCINPIVEEEKSE